MATPGRRTVSSVEEMLFTEGFQFDFFQAVRLLALVDPQKKPIGGPARPAEEIVRFTAWPPETEKLSTVVSFIGLGFRGMGVIARCRLLDHRLSSQGVPSQG